MRTELLKLNKERNVTLTCYIQDVGGEFRHIVRRPAVLVLPGGGYQSCSDREADPVAFAYMKYGFHAFVLRYSVGQYNTWPNPLNDVEQAMGLLRKNADAWHVEPDKIVVVGFSAGGHLAACAASMAVNRPNAAILGYPEILGDSMRRWLKDAPDAAAAVSRDTVPCFLFTTSTDELVSVENTLAMAQALQREQLVFEMHVYSYGAHGLSTADDAAVLPGTAYTLRAAQWVRESVGFLKEVFGNFVNMGYAKPSVGRFINGDREPCYSVDSSIGHILRSPAASAVLKPLFAALNAYGGSDSLPGMNGEAFHGMTLRAILAMGATPVEQVAALDQALRAIPNPEN